MKRLFLAFAGLSLLVLPSSPVMSQDIEISGSVDVGYTHSFNDPRRGAGAQAARSINDQDDSFQVRLAQLVISKEAEPVGFNLKIDYGDQAKTSALGGTNADDFEIQEANIVYNLDFGNGVTITAGKFVTLLGRDVFESKDNWFMSHGLIFQLVPLTHTGVRASYPVMDNVTATLGLNNGANADIDGGHGKSIEAALAYDVTEELSVSVAFNYGENGNTDGDVSGSPEGDKVWQVSLIGNYDVTEDLSAYAELLYGTASDAITTNTVGTALASPDDADIWGIGFGAQYKLSDKYGVSVRYEYTSQERGNTPFGPNADLATDQNNWDVTLAGHCYLAEDLELRVEYRHDSSNQFIFADDSLNGPSAGAAPGVDDTNDTLGVQLIYSF